MDQQEHQRVNQAAEEFRDALKRSLQAATEQGVNVEVHNFQLTQEFSTR